MPVIQALNRMTKETFNVTVDTSTYRKFKDYEFFIDNSTGKVFREEQDRDNPKRVLRIALARDVLGFKYNDSRTAYFNSSNYLDCREANLRVGTKRTNKSQVKSSAGYFWPLTWTRLLNFLQERDPDLHHILWDAIDFKYSFKAISFTLAAEDYDTFMARKFKARLKIFLRDNFDWDNLLHVAKDVTSNYKARTLFKEEEEEASPAKKTRKKRRSRKEMEAARKESEEQTGIVQEVQPEPETEPAPEPEPVVEPAADPSPDPSPDPLCCFWDKSSLKKTLLEESNRGLVHDLLQDPRLFLTEDLIRTLQSRGVSLVQWG